MIKVTTEYTVKYRALGSRSLRYYVWSKHSTLASAQAVVDRLSQNYHLKIICKKTFEEEIYDNQGD